MGRPSHTQTLSIWANAQRVGEWSVDGHGTHSLRYDPEWVASDQGRPLSLSLPFLPGNRQHSGERVLNFFDNLLPDNEDIRKRLAQRFKTGKVAAFELLKAIGRDCVGAVQLLEEDEEPVDPLTIRGEALSATDVEQIILGTVATPGLVRDVDEARELRISLAGAQEKTALLRWKGQWMRPRGTTPTTHIIKLPLGFLGPRKVDFTASVDNEWLCLRLLREMGLGTASARIETFGEERVLAVERFDRRLSSHGTHLLRLPQEDFCQARGHSYLSKYEDQGGPGLPELAQTLRGSEVPHEDLRTLLKAQLLFWMLRAPDQHAKNFSIFLLPGGRFRLTPLYDVLSAWPVIGDGPNQWGPQEVKLAMCLRGKNRHYEMARVQRRHFNKTAALLGYGRDMEDIIEEVLASLPGAMELVRSAAPKDLSARAAERIFRGLEHSAKELREMPSA